MATPSPAALLCCLLLASGLSSAWPAEGLALNPGGDDPRECPKGQTWSGRLQKCISSDAGDLTDEERTRLGRALARDGQYVEAIGVLESVKRPNDAVALTYLGYSHRKLGRIALGISYYHKALAIDPDNVNTREYLGEGYLSAGRPDLARAQLAAIEQRCGTGCEAYRELRSALDGNPVD
jgi:tetratricopeptide (TPR) repeat protein